MVQQQRREGFTLEYPQHLAYFDQYAEAQRAVDYLSDQRFPVENIMIVGTDLKQVERVTGRLTWGKVAGYGAGTGAWFGLLLGLIVGIFAEPGRWLAVVLSAILIGLVFGIIWGLIGYAFTGGRRDFTSISQVVASRYELLVEHKLLADGQRVLSGLIHPATQTSAQTAPQAPPAAPPQPPTQPPTAPPGA
ncbi:general stress protein [Mumia sp. DW29H23]|uniref:general stress protein n=1 Tax=Mumia sp. DW29H23 TaxID=3421241 RepID=UPI003D68D6A8